MKKMYILALAAATMAFSCNKNAVEQAPVQEPVLRTFTCTIAESDTKLAIDDATGKTTWEVGDEILVHGEGSSNREIVTLKAGDISADGKTATITITSVTPYDRTSSGYISNYYASYPASACPTGNWYWNSRFNDTNHFLLFGCNDGDTFKFYNLCGIISFKVTGDFDSYIFSGNGDETVGYSALQSRVRVKTNHDVTIDYVRTGENDGYTTVPLTSITGTVVGNGSTINYICLPNGANFPDGFTIKFLKGGSIVKTLSTTSSVSVTRNSYRPMGDVTAYLKDYVAPVPPATHDSSIDMAGATALDGSGNANCYVVDGSVAANAEKVFTFKAYKGNSAVGVGTIASTAILWETWNNAETVTANSVIAAVDFDKQEANDYYTMVFKMPATLHAGNAVLAAKDAGGNILWSWHIWVPSTSIANVNASNICGATMMDRNLGALEKVSTADGASVYTLGMLYQWGRKDPFPGGKRITDTWPNPATVSGTAPSVHSGTITMDYAIAHPTEFASNSGGDWQATSDMTRWNKDAKTVNDPCPPGYKIPYGERGSKPLWNTSNIETAVTGAGMTWELSSTGYWFRIADGGNELVFPLAGYVEDGASSYGIGNTQTRAAIWCLSDSGSSKYHLNIRSGSTMAFGSTSAARGCSVRCVAE